MIVTSPRERAPLKLEAVILDWAGTTIDEGSRAPVEVFSTVFAELGLPLDEADVRGPMGRAKRDHIATLLALPKVSKAWAQQYGRAPGEDDTDELYERFLELQKQVLERSTTLIPGLLPAIAACREAGLAIGSNTGYTLALMEPVKAAATKLGYTPDATVCSDEVKQGRPAPDMIYEVSARLGGVPMASVLKVDDTPVGIRAGLKAGAWTAAVARTGNEYARAVLHQCPDDALKAVREQFIETGAHFVIDSIAELPDLVKLVNTALERGERPC